MLMDDFTLIAGTRVALMPIVRNPNLRNVNQTLLSQIIALNQVDNPKREFPTQLFQLEL